MAGRRKNPWLDPNKEGKSKGRRGKRYCARCGNTVRQSRILKVHNLCEYCVQEMIIKKEQNWVCRGCGRFAPEEVKAGKGYCRQCLCPACGQPDPTTVPKFGLCRKCAKVAGVFCLRCGKEAPAQVIKNKGYCDRCAQRKPNKDKL
jgi:hypothetical protein